MPLTPKLFLTDIATSESPVEEWTVSFHDVIDLDRIGTMGATVLLGTLGANQILLARPPHGNQTAQQARLQPRPILAEFSFSGSRAEIDHRAMIIKVTTTGSSQGPSIGFDNDDLALGLSMNQVDRMTLVNVLFLDLLNADPGQIRVYSDSSHDTGLLPEGTPVPWIKGVLRTTIGSTFWPQRQLLDWIGVPSDDVGQLKVTVAYNADPITKALELAAKRLAGLNLGDGSKAGTHGHIVYDTSSVDLNLGTGITAEVSVDRPAVVIGYLPTTPFLDIVQGALPDTFDSQAPIGDGLITTTDLLSMTAQLEILGGRASQGLPVNAQVTSIVVANKNLSAPSSGGVLPIGGISGGGPPTPGLIPGAIAGQSPSESWQASLPIVGVFIAPAAGGAYYYPGDGAYYPIGQCPGVNELLYDEVDNQLYAATQYGVRMHTASTFDALPWTKVGNLRYPVDRIWLHRFKASDGSSHFYIFSLVNAGQAGIDGIWSYPPVNGVADEDAPGWSRMLNQPKITAFCPIPGTPNCVFTIGDRPWMINTYGPLVGGVPEVGITPLEMPLFESVTRLDPGPSGHFFVLTGAGSAGLYMDGPALNLNPGTGPGALRDVDGQPINVNRLIPYTDYGGLLNGTPVAAIACTNRGLWFTPTLNGTGWKPMNGQSGLAGQDVSMAAVGGIRRIIDRDGQALYALVGQGSDVVVSFSGGLWWEPTIARSLELGTLFSELAAPRLFPTDPLEFPDWDITAVGSGVNPAPGIVVPVPPNSTVQLPPNYQIARRDTYTNAITYRIVNTESTAPYFGIESMTLSDIYSGVEIDQSVAEEALLGVGLEYLYNASMPQTMIQLNTWFSEPSHKARRLRPNHMVTLTYQGTVVRLDPVSHAVISTEYAKYDHEQFYVLTVERDMADGSSVCNVKLTLGKFLLKTPPTPDELAANVLYGFKNDRRYL